MINRRALCVLLALTCSFACAGSRVAQMPDVQIQRYAELPDKFQVLDDPAPDTLPPEYGIGWDVPYPNPWAEHPGTTCGEFDDPKCCMTSPPVGYILRVRLPGETEFTRDYSFNIFFPPKPLPAPPCEQLVDAANVLRMYDFPPGTVVEIVLHGWRMDTGQESGPSNVVALSWPWLCGGTRDEIIACVLDCQATRGEAWCV